MESFWKSQSLLIDVISSCIVFVDEVQFELNKCLTMSFLLSPGEMITLITLEIILPFFDFALKIEALLSCHFQSSVQQTDCKHRVDC